MIKGWFVKLWGRQPLIFTELVRVLSPQPWTAWIREHVPNRRRVGTDESWLYYETLRQLQLTNAALQRQQALAVQQRRIDQLLAEVRLKAANDRSKLDAEFRRGNLPQADSENRPGYDSQVRRLERQLKLRETRYAAARRDPATFPLFVDLFQNPELWQGELVTLQGYVRRVLSHPADPALFNGQSLHELWLYTRDSQHIPTVVVTPTLPRDFPLTADLVDSITVTGCFYRMYVYKGQSETRQAPLVLAGRIDWKPSTQHVLNLVREGKMPPDAPLAVIAKANSPGRLSDTVLIALGVLAVVISMAVFGAFNGIVVAGIACGSWWKKLPTFVKLPNSRPMPTGNSFEGPPNAAHRIGCSATSAALSSRLRPTTSTRSPHQRRRNHTPQFSRTHTHRAAQRRNRPGDCQPAGLSWG
jgi:hypothetical protein